MRYLAPFVYHLHIDTLPKRLIVAVIAIEPTQMHGFVRLKYLAN